MKKQKPELSYYDSFTDYTYPKCVYNVGANSIDFNKVILLFFETKSH